MFRALYKLQKSPEGKRRKVTIMLASGITLLIFLIWISIMMSKLQTTNPVEVERDQETVSSPVSSFVTNFNEGLKEIKIQFQKLREMSPF